MVTRPRHRTEIVGIQNIIADAGDHVGVFISTRMQSSIMADGRASSAAPGLGSVESYSV